MYGLHAFQESAVCLQHILLDRKDVPETNLVFIMGKKANNHKQLSKSKMKNSIFTLYIHPHKCKKELLALEGSNFSLSCSISSVNFWCSY